MAMTKALELEKIIYNCLIDVHNVAEALHDRYERRFGESGVALQGAVVPPRWQNDSGLAAHAFRSRHGFGQD